MALSQQLGIPYLEEYARTYLEEHGPDYNLQTILQISTEHQNQLARFPSNQPMILDTYLYNFLIWAEDKYGQSPRAIVNAIEQTNPFDFVLLMYPDIEWVQDGLREDADRRMLLLEKFQGLLEARNENYHIIKGEGPSRINSALEFIQPNI